MLWLRKGPFSPLEPQLWTHSFAKRKNWAPHHDPVRPLGKTHLALRSGRPGSASERRLEAAQHCSVDPAALPPGPRGKAGGRLPALSPEAPSQSCQLPLQIQTAPFPLASGTSSWKPVNGRDFLSAEGIRSRSPIRSPQGAQGTLRGFSNLSLCASEP